MQDRRAIMIFLGDIQRIDKTHGMPEDFWDVLMRYLDSVYSDSVYSEHDKKLNDVLSLISRKASDARYERGRALKKQAASVAQQLWEDGSSMMHHKMKKYLIEEYQDGNGKYPFVSMSENVLLKTVKQVAINIGRPDLISGQKKSK